MKLLRVAVATLGLLAGVLAGGAQATPAFYGWGLTFVSGSLAGQTAVGTLSVDGNDCPGGVCSGLFAPDSAAHTLLSLNIAVNGFNFAMTNDTGCCVGFPIVTFTN